jgi:hypothetical protein
MTKPLALYVIEIGLFHSDSPYELKLAKTKDSAKKWLRENGWIASRETENKELWKKTMDYRKHWARFYEDGEKLEVID